MRILFLAAAAVLACGCSVKKAAGPRVMRLSIAADEEFRARPDWEAVIRKRVEKISEAWGPRGIRWEVAVANPWVSENGSNAERLRAALRGGTPGGSAVLLGISGQQPSDSSLGFVAPFTRVLLVYDFPQQSETVNTAILSHQLARLFGAWDSPDPGSVMSAHPAGLRFDAQAAAVIDATRNVDFQAGIHGMDTGVIQKLELLYGSKNDPLRSPVYLARVQAGEELLANRNPEAALAELRKAIAVDPQNARLRSDAGMALVAMNEIPAAIAEFREVVRLQPQSPGARANLGALLTRSGSWVEGNAEIRKALQMSPNEASLHFTLATALMHTPGQMDAGIAEVQAGLRLNPNSELGKALLENAQKARAQAGK